MAERMRPPAIGRRRMLKTAATGLTTSLFSGLSIAKHEPPLDTARVDWKSDVAVAEFVENLNLLDEDGQEAVLKNLDISQEEAIVRTHGENLEYTREVTFATGESITATPRNEDGPSPQGIPTSYAESVQAKTVIGNPVIEFFHTIEWQFDGDSVSSEVSAVSGETYADLYSYEGPDTNSLTQYSSFFDWYREGKFVFDPPLSGSAEFYPHIELRGKANGEGVTLSKDDGL